MTNIRVLLVDRNDDFLDAVAAWMGAAGSLQVVGRAHTGAEALERVERLEPDVVVMDLALPDLSGLEATRRIKRRAASPLVVLTCFHDSRAARAEAAAAGADEAVPKSEVVESLLPAIRRLLRLRGDGGRTERRREP